MVPRKSTNLVSSVVEIRIGLLLWRDVIKRLKNFGFSFNQQAARSHEICYQAAGNRYTIIPNHPGDLPGIIPIRSTV